MAATKILEINVYCGIFRWFHSSCCKRIDFGGCLSKPMFGLILVERDKSSDLADSCRCIPIVRRAGFRSCVVRVTVHKQLAPNMSFE